MAFRQTGWFLADDRFHLKTWIQELREFEAVEQRIAGDKKRPLCQNREFWPPYARGGVDVFRGRGGERCTGS